MTIDPSQKRRGFVIGFDGRRRYFAATPPPAAPDLARAHFPQVEANQRGDIPCDVPDRPDRAYLMTPKLIRGRAVVVAHWSNRRAATSRPYDSALLDAVWTVVYADDFGQPQASRAYWSHLEALEFAQSLEPWLERLTWSKSESKTFLKPDV